MHQLVFFLSSGCLVIREGYHIGLGPDLVCFSKYLPFLGEAQGGVVDDLLVVNDVVLRTRAFYISLRLLLAENLGLRDPLVSQGRFWQRRLLVLNS